ncbi:MAG: ABC transporter substrate-binding protein [Methylovulum sp.]|nr:ABC transporter substrate-binding protein [Methylovulum sp.]
MSIAIIAAYIFFIGYYDSYDYSLRRRAQIASQNNAEIHVAAVWNLLHEQSFIKGVKLAVNELNAQGIELKDKGKSTLAHIVLHEYDDGNDDKAENAWLSIGRNHQIVAVVGHSSSVSAIPASISYEYNGVLFISAIATDPALTNHNLKYTFSICPSDKYFVNKLVDYAKSQKFFKLIILYTRDDYGINFYQEFSGQLDGNFEVAASRSFYPLAEDIEAGNMDSKTDMIFQVMQSGFDAIVLIARDEVGVEMIRQLRSMGITQPILGGDGLDNQVIWNTLQPTPDKTLVTSVFAANDAAVKNSPQVDHFVDNYQKTYGLEPGYLAIQGYEAMMVLARAFQLTGTTVPIKVGSTLRYHFQDSYNNYAFDSNGMIANKTIYIKEISDGKSKIIATEPLP